MATKKTAKPAAAPRKRRDWEAVERDFRTGKFTLRELEAKHGIGYADISRRSKKDGWTKDLAAAVRQATSAALIAEITTAAATEAQQSTTAVVLAAAEVNKQVILGHRKQLAELQAHAQSARDKLVALGATAADIKEAAVLVSALESAARTTKIVIEAERKAFGITDDEAPEDQRRRSIPIEFVEADVEEG